AGQKRQPVGGQRPGLAKQRNVAGLKISFGQIGGALGNDAKSAGGFRRGVQGAAEKIGRRTRTCQIGIGDEQNVQAVAQVGDKKAGIVGGQGVGRDTGRQAIALRLWKRQRERRRAAAQRRNRQRLRLFKRRCVVAFHLEGERDRNLPGNGGAIPDFGDDRR